MKYPGLAPGTLVGVLRVHQEITDFREHRLRPGLYTLRYAHQPEDGDHQGTADSRDFLVLSPASADPSPEPVGAEELLKRSSRVSGKKHPSILYLARLAERGATVPRLVHDENAERWLVEGEIASSGGGEPLRVWIVVVGHASEF